MRLDMGLVTVPSCDRLQDNVVGTSDMEKSLWIPIPSRSLDGRSI